MDMYNKSITKNERFKIARDVLGKLLFQNLGLQTKKRLALLSDTLLITVKTAVVKTCD
jgi:hypothetical protein